MCNSAARTNNGNGPMCALHHAATGILFPTGFPAFLLNITAWQHMSSTDKSKDAIHRKIPIMDFVTLADIKAFQALPMDERRRVIRTHVEIELLGQSLIDGADASRAG